MEIISVENKFSWKNATFRNFTIAKRTTLREKNRNVVKCVEKAIEFRRSSSAHNRSWKTLRCRISQLAVKLKRKRLWT